MNREDYNEPISLRNVHITDNFWKNEMELVRKRRSFRISGMR